MEEDDLTLVRRDDGSTSLVPALSSKDSSMIEDNNLPWDDFCIVAPHMISAMSWSEWPPECITMMTEFWTNINMHPYRSSRDPLNWSALLLYQAEQRKLWHQAINSPGHGYNLSQINKELLHQMKDRIYWMEWGQRDSINGRDYIVSTTIHLYLISLMMLYPFFIFTFIFWFVLFSRSQSFTSLTMHHYHIECLSYMMSQMLATNFSGCTPLVSYPAFYMVYDGNSLRFSIHISILLLFFTYGTSTSWEFMHVTVIIQPFRDITRTHVGVPGPLSTKGLGPGNGPSISSGTPMNDKTRIFPMAQTRKPTPFVPSAWAPTHTMSTLAPAPSHGMVGMWQWPKGTKETSDYNGMTPLSAWTGKGGKAVPAPSMMWSTFAQVVGQLLMVLTGVLKHRKHKALTPYHPDEWEVSFRNICILSQASMLVSILVSQLSLPLKPLLIKTRLLNLRKNLKKSYTVKFKKEDTLGQSQAERLKHLLAPSSVLPFQLFQSQDELANIVTFRTIRSWLLHPIFSPIHWLIHMWIQLLLPQLGAPSLSSCSSFTV